MNTLSKVLVSIIGVLVIGFVGILLYIYWPAITGTINGNKYYTAEELQEAYDEGYNDGNASGKESNEQLEYYKTLVDEYYIEVDTLNGEIDSLNLNLTKQQEQMKVLQEEREELSKQVANLTTIKENNDKTIKELNNQIDLLKSQIEKLSTSETDKLEEIERLNEQVENLEILSNQLQMTNKMNVETISSLNSQISSLNNKISEMTLQNQNVNGQITSLNNKIIELQKSISYYEQYIASLESGEQVVATFEFDGSVYNIQIVNANSILTVTTPQSTKYKIFNGWTVDGEIVDLSTYQITKNTKFVADITYNYDVKFMVDNQEISSQLIEEGQFATVPENTEKEGYIFDGWSLDGVNIAENIESIPVTQNVTYQALYSKVFKVEFVYNEETISTQQIKSGELAKNVSFAVADNEIFNGWTVDEILVDIESYRITADTIFVASISHKFEVKFMVDDEVVDSQFVIENNFASLPEEPTKSGFEFKGWSINGEDIIDISKTVITEDTTYIAVFVASSYDVLFVVDGDIYDSQSVVKNGYASLPESPTKDGYAFDGWSLNNVTVIDNISSTPVTQNTTYYAVFTKLYKVTFMYEDTEYSSQQVRSGSCAQNVIIENTTYKIFNGWKLINSFVDVATYKIFSDTTFIADLTYKFDVKFMVDGSLYNSQIITENEFAVLPNAPTKSAYKFVGWSLNGSTIVNDITTTPVTQNVTYQAIFEKLPTLQEASWSYIAEVSDDIRTNGLNSSEVQTKYGWKVGDEKTIQLSTGEEIVLVILGYNHDNLTSGGKAGISFGMKDCLKDRYRMNEGSGTWDTSEMRTVTLQNIFTQLPSDLQAVIKEVNKESWPGSKSMPVVTTSDKLWLLSEIEVTGKTDATSSYADGTQYEYWITVKDGSNNRETIKESNGLKTIWWLRSAGRGYPPLSYVNISSTGTTGFFAAGNRAGVSFGFCV